MDVSEFMHSRSRALGAATLASIRRDIRLALQEDARHELFWVASSLGSELVRLDYSSAESVNFCLADLAEVFRSLGATEGHLLVRDITGTFIQADPFTRAEICAEVRRTKACTYFSNLACRLTDASLRSWSGIRALTRLDEVAPPEVWGAYYDGDLRAIAALDQFARNALCTIDSSGRLSAQTSRDVTLTIGLKQSGAIAISGESLDLYTALQSVGIMLDKRPRQIFRMRQHRETPWFLLGDDDDVSTFCQAVTRADTSRPMSYDFALPNELARAKAESDGNHIIALEDLINDHFRGNPGRIRD